jgi:hypothetical protein
MPWLKKLSLMQSAFDSLETLCEKMKVTISLYRTVLTTALKESAKDEKIEISWINPSSMF